MPSIDHFRGLGQSFGPRVAHSLWNTDDAKEQQLQAPNGARLAVRGENGHEQVALHQFVEGGMGVEGIKYMVALLAAYDEQTGSLDRKTDARITLRQMLIFMGKGDHADDLDEQRKLMHYILYLARTWITALDKIQEPVKRRGRPRRGYQEYTPLIVLEALGSDERGGIRIRGKARMLPKMCSKAICYILWPLQCICVASDGIKLIGRYCGCDIGSPSIDIILPAQRLKKRFMVRPSENWILLGMRS